MVEGKAGGGLQHAFAQAGNVFEDNGGLEVAGVRAAGILSQPYSSLGARRFDRQSAEDFDPKYMPMVEWPKDAHGDVFTLLPIFRLPNLIHTRSGNSKFLYEISHKNPLWVNPVDAKKLGGSNGRPAEGSHGNRILRAARLGYGGPCAGRGGVFSSSGALAHK